MGNARICLLLFVIAVLMGLLIYKVDRIELRAPYVPVPPSPEPPPQAKKEKEVYDKLVFVRSKSHSFASEIAVPIKLSNCVGVELYQASVPQGQHTLITDESVTVVDGGTTTFTLPTGTYTLSSLASKFTSASPTAVSMSYSKTTFLVTVKHASAAFTMTLSEALSDILGIAQSSTSSAGAPYVVVGTNRTNLYGSHVCTVKAEELHRYGTSDDVLARIPLTDQLTFYTPDAPLYRPFPRPHFVDHLTIRMEDFDTGNLIDFNGLEYTLTLNFKIVRYKQLEHDEVLSTS